MENLEVMMAVNETIQADLKELEEETNVLDFVKEKVPLLEEESIKQYLIPVIDGKKSKWEDTISSESKLTVIVNFAGGFS